MPRYDAQCTQCKLPRVVKLDFDTFDHCRQKQEIDGAFGDRCPRCGETTRHRFVVRSVPSVHYKGYGFYRKDNLSEGEKYEYDHFDGSGTNPELKQMSRMIQDPATTVPLVGPGV